MAFSRLGRDVTQLLLLENKCILVKCFRWPPNEHACRHVTCTQRRLITMLWQKIIFCSNPSIFLYFGYRWYSMLSSVEFLHDKISENYKLKCLDVSFFFSCWNFNKLSIKYRSYRKSRKIDAFGQEICFLSQPYSDKHCLFVSQSGTISSSWSACNGIVDCQTFFFFFWGTLFLRKLYLKNFNI